jgi:hypothetical protein
MRHILTGIVALALMAGPAFAAKNGFGSNTDTSTTQGNSGKQSPTSGAADSSGTQTTTTTTSGPNGALKNGNSPDSNVTTTTTTSGPGNSNK